MAEESLSEPRGRRHRSYEDILAILTGALAVSIGLTLYAKATLTTGSTSGAALLTHYVTGWDFGVLFFLINIPFYVFAVLRMGWVFAFKTFAAVALVSLFTLTMPGWMRIEAIDPVFAAVAGGMLSGLGALVLVRHKSSLGGVTILGLYLQQRYGVRAGLFQLAVDSVVLVAAFFVLPWDRVLLSLLGAVVFNLIIAINHRPGRYSGFS